MPEVLVERCRLTLVQRHPWGADRDEHVRRAIAAIPALIGEALDEVLAQRGLDDTDLVLEEPLRITVPLRLDELRFVELGLPAPLRTPGSLAGRTSSAALDAIRQAIEGRPELARELPGEPGSAANSAEPPPRAHEPLPHAWRQNLLAVLLAWRQAGQLLPTLVRLESPTLASLVNLLLEPPPAWQEDPDPPGSEAGDPAIARVLLDDLRRSHASAVPPRAAAIALALALAELWELPAHASRVRAATQRAVPELQATEAPAGAPQAPDEAGAQGLPGSRGSATAGPLPPPTSSRRGDPRAVGATSTGSAEGGRAADAPPADPEGPPRPSIEPASASRRPARRTAVPVALTGEHAIGHVLPFLVLGTLQRAGWVEGLCAGAHLGGGEGLLSAVALALGRKLVPPPERGWRWTPPAEASARAFCGSTPPPDGEELERADRELGPALDLATNALLTNLVGGHRPGSPLWLIGIPAASGGGWALFDSDGLFPMGWAAEPEGLIPAARLDLVVIPQHAADPTLVEAFVHGGVRFLTDAPPSRRDRWRSLRRGRAEAWTNAGDLEAGPALATLRDMQARSELIDGLWEALAERPADPHRRFGPLERAVTLAAAVGLADLGWHLWRSRETTDGLLALERLSDLDARVSFESDRVRVRIPMGLRHRDLYAARAIDDLRAIPWLGHRPVEFSGG